MICVFTVVLRLGLDRKEYGRKEIITTAEQRASQELTLSTLAGSKLD